jgi:hypothetical protein
MFEQLHSDLLIEISGTSFHLSIIALLLVFDDILSQDVEVQVFKAILNTKNYLLDSNAASRRPESGISSTNKLIRITKTGARKLLVPFYSKIYEVNLFSSPRLILTEEERLSFSR